MQPIQPIHRLPRQISYGIKMAVVALTYYAAARIGLLLAFKETNVSPVWPPAGIAVGSLLILGIRYWPAVTLGAFCANLFSGLTPVIAGVISVGNTLEAVWAVLFLNSYADSQSILKTSRNVFVFFTAALVSPMIAATVGTTAIHFAGYDQGLRTDYLWWTWWLGDSVGILVIAPLILSWRRWPSGFTKKKRWFPAVILYLLLAAVGILVFGRWSAFGIPLTYLTVPPIVIVAFKYQQRGASFALVLLMTIAVWETTHAHGPFNIGTMNGSLLFLAMFVGVMAATALILAAVVTEWKQAEKRRNEAAESALRMKDIAIQEIHHRVKNNLQVVSSLINLQRSNSPGATVEEVFAESQSRIRAIALTYELLHQLQEHQQINFADYVDLLAQEIFRSCELTEKSITVLVDPRKFELELESAIPLGLITNELIRHSCKSIRSQPSQIKVHINNVEKNIHYLFANSESELSDHQSFTSRLIDVLTSQLKGQTNYIDGHGIELHITFPRLLTETVPPRILA